MASHKTYLHFNKGLILENLKKRKKKYSFRPSERILSNNYIFQRSVTLPRWSTCHAHKRAFSHQLLEERFVYRGKGRGVGSRESASQREGGGWRATYD